MKSLLTLMLLAITTTIMAAGNQVALPENYRDTYVEYLSLDRVQNPDQFIRLFANDIAMQGADSKGELQNGSVLVAEVYSVQKNQDGTVKQSALNRRIKDKLVLLAVMEKQAGFGKTSGSAIHTGDWDFAAYKPNGETAPKNLDGCRACHAPLTNSDFVFSIEHFPTRK